MSRPLPQAWPRTTINRSEHPQGHTSHNEESVDFGSNHKSLSHALSQLVNSACLDIS